jgi:hypothetical protein
MYAIEELVQYSVNLDNFSLRILDPLLGKYIKGLHIVIQEE